MALFGTFLFGEEMFGAHETLMVAPHLGWANVDAILDPGQNPKVIVWELEDMEVVTTPPTRYKDRDNLIFEFQGLYYRLPPDTIDSLGGSTRHLWKIGSDPIDWFILVRGPMSPEAQRDPATWSRNQPNPRIL